MIYRLNQQVKFNPRRAWVAHARCATLYSEGNPFIAYRGALVIHIGPRQFFDGKKEQREHVYRLSDGRVGTLETGPDARFAPVDDPEIVALAQQVKSLPTMLAEKGLMVNTVSRLDPFTLIRCPMCHGTNFVTLDFASVWCAQCNTRFSTRGTAGDPGVVVDAFLEDYDPTESFYVVPRSLMLTLVIKDFGYEGNCHEDETSTRLPGLRPDVPQRGLQVYDWCLYGRLESGDQRYHRPLLVIEENNKLRTVYIDKMMSNLDNIRSEGLPSVDLLARDGEREWWCLANGIPFKPGERRGWYPVWWKVERGNTSGAWQVIDRTLCPKCLRPASEGTHERCAWGRLNWSPEQV